MTYVKITGIPGTSLRQEDIKIGSTMEISLKLKILLGGHINYGGLSYEYELAGIAHELQVAT